MRYLSRIRAKKRSKGVADLVIIPIKHFSTFSPLCHSALHLLNSFQFNSLLYCVFRHSSNFLEFLSATYVVKGFFYRRRLITLSHAESIGILSTFHYPLRYFLTLALMKRAESTTLRYFLTLALHIRKR